MGKGILATFGILVALAYVIPFTLLSEVPRFTGSFLFWIIFAGGAIALLFFIMRSWNE